jgi:uncharacterized membrane protein YccC
MTISDFMHRSEVLLGSLATIAIILTAFGLMLGIVKPADALRHIGAIMGIVILLMIGPGILLSAWSAMSLWQQLAFVAIGVGVSYLLWPRREPRRSRRE